MVEFVAFGQYKRGTLFSLLCRSYAQYFHYEPGCIVVWKEAWAEYDQEVYTNLHSVGACGFITVDNGQMVGFASWDPRQYPVGIIGHNCVLPEFRGSAYGRRQIGEVLRRLHAGGFEKVRATTGDHEFFGPARRMYRACGLREVSRCDSDPCSMDGTITFETDIQGMAVEGRQHVNTAG